MSFAKIHESGEGSDKLTVDSYWNGAAYNFSFGQAGTPMRNVFLQGDDAAQIRAEYDTREAQEPETLCRDIWLDLLDPYL